MKTPPSASAVPIPFSKLTGVWKKTTEEQMTTTLYTQLPTEWVTGETL